MFVILNYLVWLIIMSLMQSRQNQDKHKLTSQTIDSFMRSIQAMHFVRMKLLLTTYKQQITNCLDSQTRMPCLQFAIKLHDEATSLTYVKQLLKYSPNIHFKDSFGNTFLHHCCFSNNLQVFKLLLGMKIDAKVKNLCGQSILFVISKNNCEQILHHLIKESQQIDVNEVDQYGRTPLFYAVEQGNLTICEILLKLGASVSIMDNQCHLPEFYAKKNSKNQIIQLIQSHRKVENSSNDPSEELIAFNLLCLDGDFTPKIMSVAQVSQFINGNQQLRHLFENPEMVEQTKDQQQQDWKVRAQKVVNKCLLQEGSLYFSEPVIEECFGITDYYEVITNPIDFLTISKKLAYNGYARKNEFERDVERIYQNCATYNGEEHMVTQIAANIVAFFKSKWKS